MDIESGLTFDMSGNWRLAASCPLDGGVRRWRATPLHTVQDQRRTDRMFRISNGLLLLLDDDAAARIHSPKPGSTPCRHLSELNFQKRSFCAVLGNILNSVSRIPAIAEEYFRWNLQQIATPKPYSYERVFINCTAKEPIVASKNRWLSTADG